MRVREKCVVRSVALAAALVTVVSESHAAPRQVQPSPSDSSPPPKAANAPAGPRAATPAPADSAKALAKLAQTIAIPDSIQDAKLEPWRAELLDLAFKAASKFPLQPHHKNRARDQELVVEACLELDQPRRALQEAEQILGWNRGVCYADVALHLAQHGVKEPAPRLLEVACKVSDVITAGPDFQDWQRDRIRVKVAQTQLLLGNGDEAKRLATNVDQSETGKLEAVRATIADASTLDQELAEVDGILAAKNFDVSLNALDRCTRLYDRFYADAEKRGKIEERVRAARHHFPVTKSVEIATEVTRIAAAHGDKTHALELVRETAAMVETVTWLPEDHVPMRARLATLRWQAGEQEQARADLRAAYDSFATESYRIADVYHARVLRSIAEAYLAMGDLPEARAAYEHAVEAGVHNPNSRPRADDLVATCCSMAKHSFEPDAALHARLVAIVEKLSDPW